MLQNCGKSIRSNFSALCNGVSGRCLTQSTESTPDSRIETTKSPPHDNTDLWWITHSDFVWLRPLSRSFSLKKRLPLCHNGDDSHKIDVMALCR